MNCMPVALEVVDSFWYVAHTRPRCEKKLIQHCRREAISASLPCFTSKKQYGRKVVEFDKPLFPGYVFFRCEPERAQSVLRSDYTAKVLPVFEQAEFEQQLGDIIHALDSGCSIFGAVKLCAGKEARIVSGPLSGMSGKVLQLPNQTLVVLRLDFVGEGAAVVVDRSSLEVLD